MEDEEILQPLSDFDQMALEARQESINKNNQSLDVNGQIYKKLPSLSKGLKVPKSNVPYGGGAISQSSELFRLIGPDWSIKNNPNDYNASLAANQNVKEQFGRSIAGFGKQFVSGFVDSVAAWDMQGLYNVAVGNAEEEYGNWLNQSAVSKWGKDMEDLEIYQQGDSMFEPAYWGKIGQSMGYTGGIIAEMIAEQAALAYLTGGTGNIAGLASKANMLRMVGQGAFGMFKGVQEGYMNALETQKQVYDKYKGLGYDEETARIKANEAASLGFRTEVGPLMVLNGLQFMGTFGAAGRVKAFGQKKGVPELGFSGAFETAGKALYSPITNKIGSEGIRRGVNRGLGFFTNAASESIEEGIQTFAGQYAEHETMKSTKDTFGDMEVWTPEMRDSMVAGFLGGAMFGGAFKGYNYLTNGTRLKRYSAKHQSFLDNAVNRTADTFKKQQAVTTAYYKALNDYNKSKTPQNLKRVKEAELAVEQARYNEQMVYTANALQLDYINGKDTAFESHVGQMQDLLDAVNNKDLETLKRYNILDENNNEKHPGSIDIIKETFEQNIQDSYKIKELLENNLLTVTSDFQSAFDVTSREYANIKGLEEVGRLNNALNASYSNDTQYNQLSNEGKERFRLETELESFNRLEKLTETNKQRKKEIESQLNDIDNYSAKDSRIVKSINANPYVNAYTSIASLEQAVDDSNAELTKLRDANTIKSNIKERKEKEIQQAKTKEEVDEVVREARETGVDSQDVEMQAENKKSEISSEETLREVNPNFQNKPAKPEEGVKDVEEDDTELASKSSDMFASGKLSSQDSGQAFTPREFEASRVTPEDLEKIKGITERVAKRLDNDLGHQATFQDFISDKIEKSTYEEADRTFEGYKFAWDAIGRDISDADQVYNFLFNDQDALSGVLDSYFTNEDKIQQNTNIIDIATTEKSKTTQFDKDNRPVDKDGNYTKDGRTTSAKPKASHLGVQYIDRKLQDGKIVKQPVLPQLNESEQIRNHFLMDFDYIKKGITLTVEIPEDVDSIKVADWQFKDNRWVKSETTFGQWAAKNNARPGTLKYNNKVPMIAMIDDERAFFLHDTDWYNQSNIADVERQREIIKEGKQEISAVRQQVLEGNDSIRIDERNFGSLMKLNELVKESQPITLSEATGDTKLTVAGTYTELIDANSSSNGPVNGRLNLVNNLDKNRFELGSIYEIRKVNTDEYIALNVLTNRPEKGEQLNDVAYNNVKYATLASVLLNGSNITSLVRDMEAKFGMTLSKAKNIKDAIRKSTGIDIQYEIGDYYSMFVKTDKFNSNMVKRLEDNSLNSSGEPSNPVGINYISVDGGVIKIAYKDGKPVPKNPNGRDKLRGINLNALTERSTPIVVSILEQNFGGDTGRFRQTRFDISKDQIGKNKSFTKINSDGSMSPYEGRHGEDTYEAYIKDNVKTNIKSFQIQTKDGSTKWITDVQPMLYYSLVNEAAPMTTTTAAQRAAEETSIEMSDEYSPEVKDAIKEIPEDLKDETLRILRGIEGVEDIDLNFSRRELTQEQIDEINSIVTNQIDSISPLQQKVLTNSLFNLILSDVDIKAGTVNLADIKRRIDTSLKTYLQPEIDKIKANKRALESINRPGIQPVIDKIGEKISQLESIMKEGNKIISDGTGNTPKGDLYQKFERFLSEELTDVDEELVEESGEVDWNFNMSSLEKDVKLSFSNNLKIFFANIKKQKPNTREDEVNFAYLNNYESVDDVIAKLTEVMVGLPSSIEELTSILETKKNDPVYNQVLNKIRNSSEEIQNEILYKMIQSKLDMYMVLYSFNREAKTYSLKIINSNSSASDVRLKQQWQNNFINSSLLKTVNEERVINPEPVKKLIQDIDDLSKQGKLEVKDAPKVKSLINRLGIEVNDNTIDALVERKGNNIFTSSGILGVFKSNLGKIISGKKEDQELPISDSANNPYDDSKGVIEELIDLEIELNGTRVSKSFRVGSKSIQGAIQKMMVYDVKEHLKDPSSNMFIDLKQIPYSRRNYVLQMLETNDKFRSFFDVGFVSLEAIKQNRQKVYDDRKINKLSTTDNMLTQYAFFQNKFRALGDVLEGTNLPFRMGQMFNPSLSDKEQMILYSTAILDLTYKNFNISGDTVTLSDEVLDFMTDQIYASEFDRIVNTYRNPTDIKNYDGAAKRFIAFPSLNEITNDKGANIHDVIRMAANSGEDTDAIRDLFRPYAKRAIAATIEADVKSKVDFQENKGSWFDNGFIVRDTKTNIYGLHYFDTKYLNSKKGQNRNLSIPKLAQIAAYDFVVNQYLSENNTYQLIAGDMALYAPNIKKFTNRETGQINNIAFSRAVGESITKRMAMLIAPGNKLANSYGDSYLQIMVNDPVKITSTAREFIKQYYGSVSEKNADLLDKLNQVENSIRNLYNSRRTSDRFEERLAELEDSRDSIMSDLEKENPEIAGYFAIEGTDAQEYTTWKEHMDVLFRQGRLAKEEKDVLQAAYNKLLKGEDLSPVELKVVMNPIKPVYAGNVTHHDKLGQPTVNRVVYIKSSSFPLLPQLTRDFKLDKIRRQMESLEAREGKNVRLSYQTANKVGAINTKLTVNDLYNIPFEELRDTKLKDATIELDRNNFKIQQDTPYKTAKFLKKNQEDQSTMGSQMWKLILGNGINKINRPIFPNLFGDALINQINSALPEDDLITPVDGMISGEDLDRVKFHVEKMYFDIQRELLYDELGLDERGRPIDTNESMKALYKLLQREVNTRQYPENIIEALELTENEAGELEFVQPLWLSNGSNKFESLLNAIIANRLINIKLPGNGLIASSSEGFERITSPEELNRDIMSQVVWVDPNHTGELKTTVVDGKLRESEVLLQSKFRRTVKDASGKLKTELIDLTQQPYSRVNENGQLELDTSMIDEELLTQFSFRIPTSSHQSGAILKVVGFLPEASGDMLVVPKEHTQQIGEDFDIDKRWLYKSNYTVDNSGRIRKINYQDIDKSAQVANDFLALFEDEAVDEVLRTERNKVRRAKIKMFENGMIDVYKSVFLSPDNGVQKKINKILSFDNATVTANLINDRLNSSVDNTYFTLYSDDYQRQQMKLGADGKVGIGVHSNAVTFQAQMERLKNKIIVREAIHDEDSGKIIGYKPVDVTIGKYISDGTLGNIETLDGSRTIADVHTENQNSATDNIKAQIMGKRNENIYTMNVLTQLTFRGFDMVPFSRISGQSSIHMPSLFISQPIIRRYVELKEKNKSITSDFEADAEVGIIKRLMEEFNYTPSIDKTTIKISSEGVRIEAFDEIEYQSISRQMTGDTLYDNLGQADSNVWDSNIQIAVLQKFLDLAVESKRLSKYQGLVNSYSTQGLGISYFNVLNKLQRVQDLANEKEFENIQDLVGEFITGDDMFSNPEDIVYIPYTGMAVNIKTTEGTVLINSLVAAVDIMDKHFPYANPAIQGSIDTIKMNKTKELTDSATLDLSYKVISNLKDYIYTNPNMGLFKGDINSERSRLFFDTGQNESLASFLKRLDSAKNPLMISNELLNSLLLDDIKKDGSPSIIKHQTDSNTSFDKTDKYNAFLELLRDDSTDLGLFNGEPMTPRKLAQDLASYAYLANNENGAIGFRDFINVKYLNLIGMSDSLRTNSIPEAGVFIQQFYQHNPEESYILSSSNVDIKDFEFLDEKSNKERNRILGISDENRRALAMTGFLRGLETFNFKEGRGVSSDYIAVRDTSIKLSDNQYALFKWNGYSYEKIPVLGTFGYNEYDLDNPEQYSLIYPEVGNDPSYREIPHRDTVREEMNIDSILDTSTGISSVLEQLKGSGNSEYRELALKLSPYIDSSVEIKIESVDRSDGNVLTTGMYRKSNNTIYISPNIVNNLINSNQATPDNVLDIVEEVVLEEVIHSITVSELDKHGQMIDGEYVPNNDAPVFISRLSRLYEIAKENLPNEYYTKNIYEFTAGAFVSEEFRDKLDNTKHNGKTLYQIFKDAIVGMLRYITGSSYSDEVINSVYELLDASTVVSNSVEDISSNRIKQMKKADRSIDVELTKAETPIRATVYEKQLSGNVEVIDIKGNKYTVKPSEIISYPSDAGNIQYIRTFPDGNMVMLKGIVPSVDIINNIRGLNSYSKDISDQIIKKFDAGEDFIVTPRPRRGTKKIEIQYVQDIIDHIKKSQPKDADPADAIQIKNIDSLTQIISKRVTLAQGLSSGLFTTGIEDYESGREFRLPEIKNCK